MRCALCWRCCLASFLVALFSITASDAFSYSLSAKIAIKSSAQTNTSVRSFGLLPIDCEITYSQGSPINDDILKLSNTLVSASMPDTQLDYVYKTSGTSSLVSFNSPFRGVLNGETVTAFDRAIRSYRDYKLNSDYSNLIVFNVNNVNVGLVAWKTDVDKTYDVLLLWQAELRITVRDRGRLAVANAAYSYQNLDCLALEVNRYNGVGGYTVQGSSSQLGFGTILEDDLVNVNVYFTGRMQIEGNIPESSFSVLSYVGSTVSFPHRLGAEYVNPTASYPVTFNGSGPTTFNEYARLFFYATNIEGNITYGLSGGLTDRTSDYYQAVAGYETFDKDGGGEVDGSEFCNERDRFDPLDDNGYTPPGEYEIVELGPRTISGWEEGPPYSSGLDPGDSPPYYPDPDSDSEIPTADMEDIPFATDTEKQRVQNEVEAVFNDLGPMKGIRALVTQGSALSSSSAPSYSMPLFSNIRFNGSSWSSSSISGTSQRLDFSPLVNDSRYSNIFRLARLIFVLLMYSFIIVYIVKDVVTVVKD